MKILPEFVSNVHTFVILLIHEPTPQQTSDILPFVQAFNRRGDRAALLPGTCWA
jgi:hypothetical protein